MSEEELPEGWAEANLGDLTDGFQGGRSLSGEGRPAGVREIGVLKISAVTWGEFNPDENKALPAGTVPRDHELICRGDLLISRANTAELVGAVVRVKDDHPNLMLPDKVLRIVLRADAEPDFVKFALRTPAARAHFEDNATGTSQSMRNLSQPKMAATPLWLPPLAEQRRIVEKVEALLAEVNAARARLAKIPAILKRFRQSILSAACSGRLTEEWRAPGPSANPPAEEPLTATVEWRDLPGEWRIATVAELAEFVTDGDHNPPKRISAGIPHLTARNVRNSRILVDGCTFISAQDFERTRQRCDAREGDLIVTCVGTLGATAIVPADLVFSADRNLALVRTSTAVVPSFLKIVIDSPTVQNFIAGASGATAQPHLYLGDLRSIAVPTPPLPEQQEIVRRVDALFKLADTIEARVAAATARADKLTQAILAKAFRGELVPTEAELARQEGRDYEPAATLLARIRATREAGVAMGVGPRPAGRPRPVRGAAPNKLRRSRGGRQPSDRVSSKHGRPGR